MKGQRDRREGEGRVKIYNRGWKGSNKYKTKA